MAVGVFFNKDIIMADLERFAEEIKKRFPKGVEIIDEKQGSNQHIFGYIINNNNVKYRAYMVYDRNEFGEYAISKNEWLINRESSVVTVQLGLKTLGDVFDYITGGK